MSDEQVLDLEDLTENGKVYNNSIFVFREVNGENKLIYVAVKPANNTLEYITANVDGNKVTVLPSTKNRSQVKREYMAIPNPDNNIVVYSSKHVISNAAKFNVKRQFERNASFREVAYKWTRPVFDKKKSDKEEEQMGSPPPSPRREAETRAADEPPEDVPDPKKDKPTPSPPASPRRSAETRRAEDLPEDTPDPKRPVDNSELEAKMQRLEEELKRVSDELEAQRSSTVSDELPEVEEESSKDETVSTGSLELDPLTEADRQEQEAQQKEIDLVVNATDEEAAEYLRGEAPEQQAALAEENAQTEGKVGEPTADNDGQPQPEDDMEEEETKQFERTPEQIAALNEATRLDEEEASRLLAATGVAEVAQVVSDTSHIDQQRKERQMTAAEEAAAIIDAATERAENRFAKGDLDGEVAAQIPEAQGDVEMDKVVGQEIAAATVPDTRDIVGLNARNENGDVATGFDESGTMNPGSDNLDTEVIGNHAASANAVATTEQEAAIKDAEMTDIHQAEAEEAERERKRVLARADPAMKDVTAQIAKEIAAAKKADAAKGARDEAMPSADPRTDVTAPTQDFVNAILERTEDIRGLAASGTGLTEPRMELLLQKKAAAAARKAKELMAARAINVQQMSAPSPDDLLANTAALELKARVRQGLEGAIPIYTPSQTIDALGVFQERLQEETGQLQANEQQALIGELEPYWAEFNNTRFTQAMLEMSAIPTAILRDPAGDIQLGSKVTAQTSQEKDRIMWFLFWFMRSSHLRSAEGTMSMNRFLRYAAALGNNSITNPQWNWLIWGDANGPSADMDLDGVDFYEFSMSVERETPRMIDLEYLDRSNTNVITRALETVETPVGPPPSKSTSPSAAPVHRGHEYRVVDGKLMKVPLTSRTVEQLGRDTLAGIPHSVSNIPDPRYSQRGGQSIHNVRIVTRRNPNWDPSKPDSREFITHGDDPAGPNDKFQNIEVPDVGAGSKDIGAEIERAEADRLTALMPFKLYAPIHPQACDRYLGERNYARLALDKEKYFKSYTQQPFGPNDVQQQYNWNAFVMGVYGPMLYAFVTDAAMQLDAPVFTMDTPEAVTLEFMELNELIDELSRYQSKSADRSSRVGDSAVAQAPLEKHLSDFYDSREREEKDQFDDANAVVISLPDNPPPRPGGKGGDDSGGDTPDEPKAGLSGLNRGAGRRVEPGMESFRGKIKDTTIFGMGQTKDNDKQVEMDMGIRRKTEGEKNLTYHSSLNAHRIVNDPKSLPVDHVERRTLLFRQFNR